MTERLIDRHVRAWKSQDNVQHLAVVGDYGVVEADPVKRHLAEKFHEKVRPKVEHQLSIRGADKPFKFKAFGYRWMYRPTGVGE